MTTQKNIYLFSPHPDDIELYCGGALLDHYARGDAITIVFMNRGEKGSRFKHRHGDALGKLRMREAEQCYARLPKVKVEWMPFHDGDTEFSEERLKVLADFVREKTIDLAYLPELREWSQREHGDHAGTAQLVTTALKGTGTVLRYYHSKQPNTLIDVTPYYWQNFRAMLSWRSQYSINATYLIEFGWQRHKECIRLGQKIDTRYAEGFREAGGNTV